MACQESDRLIVAKKSVKAGGVKGAANSHSQRRSKGDTRGRKPMVHEAKGIRYAEYPKGCLKSRMR